MYKFCFLMPTYCEREPPTQAHLSLQVISHSAFSSRLRQQKEFLLLVEWKHSSFLTPQKAKLQQIFRAKVVVFGHIRNFCIHYLVETLNVVKFK